MPAPYEMDVVVIGGGPAGLAAGIALRQAGLEVAVIDAAKPPIDKACGEGIMPPGVAALAELGINISPRDAIAFRGIRFIQSGNSIGASFPQGAGLGVRRTTLHQLLIDRAEALGVRLHWGVRVAGIRLNHVITNQKELRCRWIIGADGQNSTLRQWSGLAEGAPVTRRFGFRRHFEVEPLSEFVDVHWSDYGQLYISPVTSNEVCAAFLTRYPHLRFRDVYDLFPDVAWRLTRAGNAEKGAVTAMRALRSVCNEGCALIGDASGSVDAITGEGLSLAFRQSLALASALKSNDLWLYHRAHRRTLRLPRAMARLLLLMDRHPQLRCRVLRTFDGDPGLFERLLAVHIGATPVATLGLGTAVSLGWRLLVQSADGYSTSPAE